MPAKMYASQEQNFPNRAGLAAARVPLNQTGTKLLVGIWFASYVCQCTDKSLRRSLGWLLRQSTLNSEDARFLKHSCQRLNTKH